MDKNDVTEFQPVERLTYTILEACEAAGCQRSTIYREAHKGHIKIRKIGRKSVILVSDVKTWIDSLPVAEFNSDSGIIHRHNSKGKRVNVMKSTLEEKVKPKLT